MKPIFLRFLRSITITYYLVALKWKKEKITNQVDSLCHHESHYCRCMLEIILCTFGLSKLSMCLNNKYLYTFFFLLGKEFHSRSEAVDIQYYATVGWPDRCCFLHTSPTHNTSSIPPLIYSTAAGLALFPNNQRCTHNYSWQTQAVRTPLSHSLQLCTCCAAWLPVEISGKAAEEPKD